MENRNAVYWIPLYLACGVLSFRLYLLYVCMYVCMYVRMSVCVCVCMYETSAVINFNLHSPFNDGSQSCTFDFVLNSFLTQTRNSTLSERLKPAKRTPPKTARTKSSNTQRTQNKATDVVIHQHSRKLLKMDILMSETC